jgi:hypothetical protein
MRRNAKMPEDKVACIRCKSEDTEVYTDWAGHRRTFSPPGLWNRKCNCCNMKFLSED